VAEFRKHPLNTATISVQKNLNTTAGKVNNFCHPMNETLSLNGLNEKSPGRY
jgi:hypothetical protein